MPRSDTDARRPSTRALLDAAVRAADLLRGTPPASALPGVLAELGTAARADRTYHFVAAPTDDDVLISQTAEWTAPGVEPQIDNPDLQELPTRAAGMGATIDRLLSGQNVISHVDDMPEAERALLESQGILTLVMVPILSPYGRLHGFLGFDDCSRGRQWDDDQVVALRLTADLVAAAHERETAERALDEVSVAMQAALSREQEIAREMRMLEELRDRAVQAVQHDVRTPLTVIRGIAETLSRADARRDEALVADLAARLASSTEALESLLSDLLMLQSATPGTEGSEETLRARDVVAQAVTDAGADAIVTVAIDDDASVHADGALLRRALWHVIDNALRHTPAGTPIRVRVHRAGGSVEFEVHDEGPGIPEAWWGRMAQPLTVGPGGAEHAPRLGVGLALAAQVALAHGGRLEFAPGPGTTVRLCMPAADGVDHRTVPRSARPDAGHP